MVERDQQAFEDVGTLLRLAQFELRATGHHVVAVIHEVADQSLQRAQLRPAVHQRDVVDAEAGLQRGVLV